jgi:hypothetical protein
MRPHIRLIAVFTVVAAIVGCVVILVSAHTSRATANPSTIGARTAHLSAAVAPELAILRRRLRPSDRFLGPERVVHQAVSRGARFGLAHRAKPAASSRIWVSQASSAQDQACMTVQPQIWARQSNQWRTFCYPSASISGALADQVQGAGASTEMEGLVPNGVTSVTVELANGGSVNGPVSGNAFDVKAGGQTAGLSFTLANGAVVSAPLVSCSASC